MVFLGIDLGTSGIKAILVNEHQEVVGQAVATLVVNRPQPLWSEQNPEDWWQATVSVLGTLKDRHPEPFSAVHGIGLAGQMHGATLLDASDQVLRPAILWNDGRSEQECDELASAIPALQHITGNLAMPGFTAPKLLWVSKHEPEIFGQIRRVLLPKDYVRLRLTGEYISDMSDSSGTLWMDVGNRAWSNEMLAATSLTLDQMPDLIEGSQPGGTLRRALADQFGLRPDVVIAGGAGDNAAGASGIGAIEPGHAFLSLGTSGVYFVPSEKFSPYPERAVHAFCHCLPDTWHQMGVILSATSCLSWVTDVTGTENEDALLKEIEGKFPLGGSEIFLPYLSGERTPHNNPNSMGVFFGLSQKTDSAALGQAVLEGVAFAFADCQDALLDAHAIIDTVSVIGGGSRSHLWGRILASVLDQQLTYHSGGEIGPAIGAARLARLAVTGEDSASVCTPPPVAHVVEPDPSLLDLYGEKRARFQRLYSMLEPEFTEPGPLEH